MPADELEASGRVRVIGKPTKLSTGILEDIIISVSYLDSKWDVAYMYDTDTAITPVRTVGTAK